MIIEVKNLPTEILNQLPFSIRIQEKIEVDSLQEPYRTLLLKYISDYAPNNKEQVNDIALNKGIYDLSYIYDAKETIVNYIYNFFTIRKGTYPFDPEFGTSIYEYLQTRNLSTFEIVINNELNDLINQLRDMFNVDITNAYVTVNTVEDNLSASIVINISLQINNENINISITT